MTWETRRFIGLPLQDERWKTFHVQCFQVKYLEKSVTKVFSIIVVGIATGKSHKKCIYQHFGSKRPQALSDGQWGQLWRSWGSTLGALIEVHSVSTCVPRNGELLHLLYHFFKQFYWGIIYTAWNLPAVSIQLRDFFGTFTQLCTMTTVWFWNISICHREFPCACLYSFLVSCQASDYHWYAFCL